MAGGDFVRVCVSRAGGVEKTAGRRDDGARHHELFARNLGGVEGSLALLVNALPPCMIFEDEHVLVVNKPAGMNTHAPSPYAGEGLYEWLKHREPRWARLAIIHRLDKETSGVMVFGKTPIANRSLTEQFTNHSIRKRYRLLTDRPVPANALAAKSSIA